jgi:hypothetical protein
MSATGGHGFEVFVLSPIGSEQDWKRVLEAEKSGEPVVYPAELAEQRLRDRGRRLGERVESILSGLGSEYQLSAILWEGFKSRWLIRLKTPNRISEIPIPAELGDGVAESGAIDDLERVKNLVLFGAGRQDLIFRRGA